MERLIVSINWALGTILLLLGIGWPWIINIMYVIPTKSVIERTVDDLAKTELAIIDSKRPFVLFSNSRLPLELSAKMSLPESTYNYDAFVRDGKLIIRAYIKPNEIIKSFSFNRPGMYELVMDTNGIKSRGWIVFSERSI